MNFNLPQWARVVLVGVATAAAIGAGLMAYHYYTRPVTLTIAAGSQDANATQIVSAIATQLTKANASIRLKIRNVETSADAADELSAGKTDLAIVRADVGNLTDARTTVLVTHGVVMLAVPPGSSIDSIDGLKGQTIGVLGAQINHAVVESIKREYDLVNQKVEFEDVALADIPKALQAKQVSAVLMVLPVTHKYLSVARTALQASGKKKPTLLAIESAGAIATTTKAYESYELPKGTLWGFPPVPDEDLTTLRVPVYIVANNKLSIEHGAELTRAIMNVRRDLIGEFPGLAQISQPSDDKDAYIPIHPGAAAYYGDTEQGFFDKYSNLFFYGPMVFGALTSAALAAWKFLGFGGGGLGGTPLDPLYALTRRIRESQSDAELDVIEEEIDNILKAELVKSANGVEGAADAGMLSLVGHRLGVLDSQAKNAPVCKNRLRKDQCGCYRRAGGAARSATSRPPRRATQHLR